MKLAVVALDFRLRLNQHMMTAWLVAAFLLLPNKRQALRWLLTDALAPILGAGLSLLFHFPTIAQALFLAGFAGFFLYIGAVDLLPESQRADPGVKTGLATVLGAAVLFAVTRLAP